MPSSSRATQLQVLKTILYEIDEANNPSINGPALLTDLVTAKSKEIVGLIDIRYYDYYDYCCTSSYSTFIVEFISPQYNIEFSLEIGRNSMGYFTSGLDIEIIIDSLALDSIDHINDSIDILNQDLNTTFGQYETIAVPISGNRSPDTTR